MKIQILPPAEPHRSTVYPDWAAAHDPARAADAAALFAEALSTLHTAYEKPGRYVDGLERLVRTLEPAHLPWFWDTLGHRLIPWHLRSAARAHALARKAEQAHGLPVDPDWHRANLLLFARAGALPATAIGTHQTWLTATLDPRAAHEEFVRFLEAWAAGPGEPPPTWPAACGSPPARPQPAPPRKPGYWAPCSAPPTARTSPTGCSTPPRPC